MNDRIQELAEQAEVWNTAGDEDKCEVDLEKFAELIIRDCSKYVADSNLVGIPRDNIPGGMIEYFGFDE